MLLCGIAWWDESIARSDVVDSRYLISVLSIVHLISVLSIVPPKKKGQNFIAEFWPY